MSLIITDDLLKTSGMSEAEFMVEIAIMLFQREKISIGKASRIAQMNQIEFQRLLSNRNINIHYDVNELQEDLENLHNRGWL